jgi:predicted transport protein
MNEITYERVKENLLALNMKSTLEIIDNYLERAIADKINVVDVLDQALPQIPVSGKINI